MKVALIIEKTVKKEVSQFFLKHYNGSVIFDLEKNISTKLLNFKTFAAKVNAEEPASEEVKAEEPAAEDKAD